MYDVLGCVLVVVPSVLRRCLLVCVHLLNRKPTTLKLESNNSKHSSTVSHTTICSKLAQLSSGEDTPICRLSGSLTGWISGSAVSRVARSQTKRRSRCGRVGDTTPPFTARERQQKQLYNIVLFHLSHSKNSSKPL